QAAGAGVGEPVLHLGRHEDGLPRADFVLVHANAQRRPAIDDVIELVGRGVFARVLALARLQADEVADQARPVEEDEAVGALAREAAGAAEVYDVHGAAFRSPWLRRARPRPGRRAWSR